MIILKMLISTYEDMFTEFKNQFNQYSSTEKGKDEIDKYLNVCSVRPRNIYTSNNDFHQRYLYESFIIMLSLKYIETVHHIGIKEIVKDIPEINQYFDWVVRFVQEVNSSQNIKIESGNFKSNLVLWLDDYFKSVDRREYGEYYTPDELIRLSFKELDFKLDFKVIDPSCGSGFFLLAYLEELVNRLELNNLKGIWTVKERMYGYDIFPFPIIITKLLLGNFLLEEFGPFESIFQFNNIKIHNTVTSLICQSNTDSHNFDLIIGNPPFFRIKPDDKNQICDCVSYGHNYIHSVFLHWSIQHLKEQGKICLFLPQSILSGFYYQKLRNEMLSECRLDLIISDKEHEKSFMVQQDIMILYLTKSLDSSKYFKIGTPNKNFTDIQSYEVPLSITKNSLRIIPVFKSVEQYQVLNRLSKSPMVDKLKLVQLNTGNFVWNQNKDIVLKEYKEGAIPLISGPNVIEGRIKLGEDTKLSYCIPDNDKYIKSENAILYRRMSPIGNKQRMVATVIDKTIIPMYVVENHVNSIVYPNGCISELNEFVEFITSEDFNILLNAFCHTNQVSTNELQTIFEALYSVRNNNVFGKVNYQTTLFETADPY